MARIASFPNSGGVPRLACREVVGGFTSQGGVAVNLTEFVCLKNRVSIPKFPPTMFAEKSGPRFYG